MRFRLFLFSLLSLYTLFSSPSFFMVMARCFYCQMPAIESKRDPTCLCYSTHNNRRRRRRPAVLYISSNCCGAEKAVYANSRVLLPTPPPPPPNLFLLLLLLLLPRIHPFGPTTCRWIRQHHTSLWSRREFRKETGQKSWMDVEQLVKKGACCAQPIIRSTKKKTSSILVCPSGMRPDAFPSFRSHGSPPRLSSYT